MNSPMADTLRRNILILLTAICIAAPLCLAELFTALSDMEDMLDTETVLINNLESYVKAQEEQLTYLRRRISEYKKEHDEAAIDISAYVSNPINAYLLTKRLTSDWKIIEQAMTNDIGNEYLKNVTMHKNLMKFPSDEDLNGAAIALIRLQDTYNLDTASVARGELNGVQYSSQMSSHDCFEMGRQSYLNKDYHHTSLWMHEAMARLDNATDDSTSISHKADILEYMAFSVFKQGDVRVALDITEQLLAIDPEHDRALGNKIYYEKELLKEAERNADRMLRGDDGSEELDEQPPKPHTSRHQDYERMCRNDYPQDQKMLAKLKCRYKRDNAFLQLAPLKYEEASLAPYIVVFHEVMGDTEIEVIKQLAKPKFRRATVQNKVTGALEPASYRISKSGWLSDAEHEVVRTVGVRIEDMTDLTMAAAEELQVVNYGIGGHYEPHYDFAGKEETNAFKNLNWGNRVATVLFYMSDVDQGGATVFPDINVAVWPKKGTAAFWFNLYKSGEGDIRTRHAACPVLAGSKWVSNKWIHEYHQEFRRPCELYPDHPLHY